MLIYFPKLYPDPVGVAGGVAENKVAIQSSPPGGNASGMHDLRQSVMTRQISDLFFMRELEFCGHNSA